MDDLFDECFPTQWPEEPEDKTPEQMRAEDAIAFANIKLLLDLLRGMK